MEKDQRKRMFVPASISRPQAHRLRISSSMDSIRAPYDNKAFKMERHSSRKDDNAVLTTDDSKILPRAVASNTVNYQQNPESRLDDFLTEPADLRCFLSGCSPANLTCNKMHRLPSFLDFKDDVSERLESSPYWTHELARPGNSSLRKHASSQIQIMADGSGSPACEIRPKFNLAIQEFSNQNGSAQKVVELNQSSATATTVLGGFPLETHIVENEAEQSLPRYATMIATNFILGGSTPASARGSSDKPHIASNATSQEVEGSVRLISQDERVIESPSPSAGQLKLDQSTKATSLLSSASRASANRHALLRPSVSESQPVDVGLPIPPVVSTTLGLPEILMPNPNPQELDCAECGPKHDSSDNTVLKDVIFKHLEGPPESVASILSLPEREIQKALSTFEGEPNFPYPPLPFVAPGDTLNTQNQENTYRFLCTKDMKCPPTNGVEIHESTSSISSEGDQWGLVPVITEAVHDAVTHAVRDIVNQSTLPPGMDKNRAAQSYRRAVANSLADAAKDIDVYLRQPSTLRSPDPCDPHHGYNNQRCHRLSCLGDLTIQHCNTISLQSTSENGTPPVSLSPAYTWRGNDCGICVNPTDQKLAEKPSDDTTVGLIEVGLTPSPRPAESVKVSTEAGNSKKNTRRTVINALQVPGRGSSLMRVRNLKKGAAGPPPALLAPDNYNIPSFNQQDATDFEPHMLHAVSERTEISKYDRSLLHSNLSLTSHNTSDVNSMSFLPPDVSESRRNPVTWLRSFLPRSGVYEPRFTAIPPRTRSHQRSSPQQRRSRTLSGRSSNTLQHSEAMLHGDEDLSGSFNNKTGSLPSKGIPKSLSRTINDLEHLLNEALLVARASADRKTCHGNDRLDEIQNAKKSDARIVKQRKSDEISLVGSIHESMRDWSSDEREEEPILSWVKADEVSQPAAGRSHMPEPGPGSANVTSELKSAPSVLTKRIRAPKVVNNTSIELQNLENSRSNRPAHLVSKLHHQGRISADVYEYSFPESRNSVDPRKIQTWKNKEVAEHGSSVYMPQSQGPLTRQLSIPYSHSLDGTHFTQSDEIDFEQGNGLQDVAPPKNRTNGANLITHGEREIELRDVPNPNLPVTLTSRHHARFNLKNRRHVSLQDHKGFSFARSYRRQAIARDWSTGRKRFCATVACISTGLVGILVGIYAGETPAIQYWIVDFHHYTVLGNVFFFIGLSIPTFLFWPLPLLHGRKPYILGAMTLAMPLLFPQALAVGQLRSPYTHIWRVALILPRALMGFCLGFANMNFKGVLTDLFGASLQSTNPHQEHADQFDVRRHGGGMGVWLGLWTWSAMGSIGVGFLIGAAIINSLNPAWGFYVSITIIAFVLLLNVLTPEVRRSAFRRSVAEVKDGNDVSRRLARGEVKMHLVQTGPKWWGEEFHYGLLLSIKMLRQPGFVVMAAYVAWMYGQIVLIVLLLGSLCSNTYRFQSPYVGLAVSAVPLGAMLAIPFQKASLFSRARRHGPKGNDATKDKKITWSSHLVRRAIFVLTLPFAGLGYTLSSGGANIPFVIPILFAAAIGFLSNLAMAECHGIIMETFDTSDLQNGMTGRNRGANGPSHKRTNYSSFPRVSSAFGITQGLGYLIAALATGVGGTLTRNLGQQAASGVMAFVLLVLSLLLLGVLIRFKEVQIIPDCKKEEMSRYHQARQSLALSGSLIPQEETWKPIIIGNPHHVTRRMCILELGSMSRFSDIRRKNRLIDEESLEAVHPNQQIVRDVKTKIKEKERRVLRHVRSSLSRHSSRASRRSLFSSGARQRSSEVAEQGDLGGFVSVELGSRSTKDKGKGREKAKNAF